MNLLAILETTVANDSKADIIEAFGAKELSTDIHRHNLLHWRIVPCPLPWIRRFKDYLQR